MDSEKRKRKAVGAIDDERRTKQLETNEDIEDEVEEFFSILRRFHTAVKYFKNENSKESKFKQKNLKFEVEDLEEISRVKNQGKREKAVEENLPLDLNIDPNIDTNST
ncbi:hypothetical protein AQUCO_02600278v1 [Aquilegia coerulea]|uniref:Uncharacterized protein n=1 Tax=Aquilegia coerulea TaxID=218851 RepID=A0A2G5D878_AQUCA|nr:hypothetical protein AQUCO_02600278v1 [Aquilegia coerulea]